MNHLSYLEANGDTLPTYESRIYDRLWDGVSYPNIDTSAVNTPTTMSRRTSSENLRELNTVAMPNPGDLEAGLRQLMRERERLEETNQDHSNENLQHLSPNSASAMRRQQPERISGMTALNADEEHPRLSPASSPEMQHISRTPSEEAIPPAIEETPPTPPIDMGRLSRVPSYNTANASNILNLDPISQALPTYASLSSSALPTIHESRSRSASRTSVNRQSNPAAQRRPPAVRGVSSGLQHSAMVGGVYGPPNTFDDPMRRISLMRNMFSNR